MKNLFFLPLIITALIACNSCSDPIAAPGLIIDSLSYDAGAVVSVNTDVAVTVWYKGKLHSIEVIEMSHKRVLTSMADSGHLPTVTVDAWFDNKSGKFMKIEKLNLNQRPICPSNYKFNGCNCELPQ